VAWTAGTPAPDECSREGERVWTAGVINDTLIEVSLVDAEVGAILDSVTIPEIFPDFYGLYGGAVDAEGNLWASMLAQGFLVRVDIDDLSYETWPMVTSGYGMTVAPSGHVFVCSSEVGRFDPVTETWDTAVVGGSGGCNADTEGRLWLASNPMVAIDVETLAVVGTYPLPEYVHGVGIDFQGRVWGVSMTQNAYRLDPVTGDFDTVTGFVDPYTYSDMTGLALANVLGP